MEEGVYWVNLLSANEVCYSSDTIYLETELCQPILIMPNVITPNNDGINDVFVPIQKEYVNFAKLTVFNRWGRVVHFSSELNSGWNASNMPDGVYYWVISTIVENNEDRLFKGYVHVIR